MVGEFVTIVLQSIVFCVILKYDSGLEHCNAVVDAARNRYATGRAFHLSGESPTGPCPFVPRGNAIRITGNGDIVTCSTDGAVHIVPKFCRIHVLTGLKLFHGGVHQREVGMTVIEFIFCLYSTANVLTLVIEA